MYSTTHNSRSTLTESQRFLGGLCACACAGHLKVLRDQALLHLRRDLGVDSSFRNPEQGNMAARHLLVRQFAHLTCAYEMFAAAALLGDAAEVTSAPWVNETVIRQLYPTCHLPANTSRDPWPLRVEDADALALMRQRLQELGLRGYDVLRQRLDASLGADQFQRAYDAYHMWCNPVMCQQASKKNTYKRAIQGLAAFGGVWSIMTLAILVLWQCLFLGCVVGVCRRRGGAKPITSTEGSDCASSCDGAVVIAPVYQGMV